MVEDTYGGSIIQYHSYLASRLATRLDHLIEGRIGLNVSHRVARKFGHKKMLEHDQRYQMAQEWMEAVSSLWESWGPDALVLDQEIPQFVDFTKVKPVNFEGKYFSTRGPLSTIPEPQRRQVFTQAGASGLGCDLATAHADVMLGLVQSPDEMVAFRKDMDRRPESLGRHPATLTAAAHSVRTSRTGVE